MLISYFIFLMIILVFSFYTGKNVSEVFLSVFEKLLYYVFGVKLVGIARSGVEYVKSKTDKKEPAKPNDFKNDEEVVG